MHELIFEYSLIDGAIRITGIEIMVATHKLSFGRRWMRVIALLIAPSMTLG